jgi:hypothetical protein
VAPELRSEGLTELVGDILITCTAAQGSLPVAPGQPVPQANISVTLSAPLSTKAYGSYVANTPTDALLLVDDPAPGNQNVCANPTNPTTDCAVTGFGPGSFNTPGTPFNVFEGVLGGPGSSSIPGTFFSITFLGVPIDPPTTSTVRTFRITNVRINASGLALGAGQGGLTPVVAFVQASSSTSISIPNPQVTVGFATPGLTTAPSTVGLSFLQCESSPEVAVGAITFKELFATAFKVQSNGDQDIPGQVYYSESGLEVPLPYPDTTSGVADTGTELAATISNIPPGVSVFVQPYAVSSASTVTQLSDACMVSPVVVGCGSEGASESDRVMVIDGTQSSPATVTVVWEITNTNSSAIDTLSFAIDASAVGTPGQPIGPVTTLMGSFWPLAATWTNGDPIPEFSSNVNTTLNPTVNLFTFSLCQTILLFPYVTDFTGFDTGIAISNTSMDPLTIGASGQTGACAVHFYAGGDIASGLNNGNLIPGVWSSTDTNAANPVINAGGANSGLIEPGQTWAFSMSTLDPTYNSTPTSGVSGYAIAVCDFQFAHGYSFVSDSDVRNFAAAYLALIIPDTSVRQPQPFDCTIIGGCSTTSQPGEQLVH